MVFSNHVMQALQEQTVGQEYAVAALTRAVTLALAGLRRPSGVLGVLLFFGPASSGKTHMARLLSRLLTGSEQSMTYINCQQLDQLDRADSVDGLKGEFNSRVWEAQPSQAPSPTWYRVVVFEQIDKAPPTFRDDLALAIDCGAITIRGRPLPLGNAFVVLISDLPRKKADQLSGRTIGFFLDGETAVEMSRRQAIALEEVDNRLGPRLVSRIDEIVVFDRLNEQNIVTLLERRLTQIEQYLGTLCIGFIVKQEAKTFLLKEGLEDLNHGVRQITRVVRNHLEFPLTDLMLSRRLLPGTTVTVGYQPAAATFLDFLIMVPALAPERSLAATTQV
jgi:ATP-dependent Clp protease ATP-binding subunit ClpC